MPVIGFKTKMPNNKILQDIIFGILAEDNIDLKKFESQSGSDATSAWGSYRKIIGKPEDV
jgi:tRNA(Glu) U13 pseudouridine synthase TruD